MQFLQYHSKFNSRTLNHNHKKTINTGSKKVSSPEKQDLMISCNNSSTKVSTKTRGINNSNKCLENMNEW